MIARTVLAASFAVALVAPALAADRFAPEALDRSVKSSLRSCFKRAERDAAKGNLLVVPGLKNCYSQASQAWSVATSGVTERLRKDPNSPCARAVEAIESAWNGYSARILGIEAVQYMAINTDDDLELAMRKHLYELVYGLSVNPDCPK